MIHTLRIRAAAMSLIDFSRSLAPDEYRAITFFHGYVVAFWRNAQ